jgi:predicted small metal-binding protein
VKHGALFNKNMIDKIKKEIMELKEQKYSLKETHTRYKNLKKIVAFLEEEYNESMEQDMIDHLNKNRYTGHFINHFLGTEISITTTNPIISN